VVEQEGRVAVLKYGKKLAKPFLDIRDEVGYDGAARNGGSIRIDEMHRSSAVRAARGTAT
jgi:hypothetical protein